MRFKCPKCGYDQLKLTDEVCPDCQLALSLRPLLGYYLKRLKTRFRRAAVTRCPRCGKKVRLNATACACGASMTLEAAIQATLEPPRKRWHHFINTIGPGMESLIRWLYLGASLAAGWWLLNYVHAQYSQRWLGYAALSAVYLAVLFFLVSWLAPRRVFQEVSRRARPVVKLALLANFLSLLLLLQLVIKAWWAQALTLVGLILVAVLGLLLSSFLMSIKDGTRQPEDTIHTKTRPQGRKALID